MNIRVAFEAEVHGGWAAEEATVVDAESGPPRLRIYAIPPYPKVLDLSNQIRYLRRRNKSANNKKSKHEKR